MTPDERKDVVRAFYARVVNGGEYDAVDELLSDDFVNHDQSPAMPHGREGIAQFFRTLRAGFPDLRYDVHLYLVDGDKVVDRGTATGTHLGEYAGFAPTGNRFVMREQHIYTVNDGKITERWALADVPAMRAALVPKTPSAPPTDR